jgi:hypothetical protein
MIDGATVFTLRLWQKTSTVFVGHPDRQGVE